MRRGLIKNDDAHNGGKHPIREEFKSKLPSHPHRKQDSFRCLQTIQMQYTQQEEKTPETIHQKAFNLGLDLKSAKEKQQQRISAKKTCFCSTQLKIPAELPNVEGTLKIHAATLLKSAHMVFSQETLTKISQQTLTNNFLLKMNPNIKYEKAFGFAFNFIIFNAFSYNSTYYRKSKPQGDSGSRQLPNNTSSHW